MSAAGTPVNAALEAALARIAATDGVVNAFTAVLAGRARATAAAAQPGSDPGLGPGLEMLAGVPFAVKNLFDIAVLPTLECSKIEREAAPAAHDAVGRRHWTSLDHLSRRLKQSISEDRTSPWSLTVVRPSGRRMFNRITRSRTICSVTRLTLAA
jgi:hypothetical protein